MPPHPPPSPTPPPLPTTHPDQIPFGGDICLAYLRYIYECELGLKGWGGGEHILTTTLMKHI